MKWYSMSQVSKALGLSVNTFKKHYVATYPPDRDTPTYKGYTESTLVKMKAEIQEQGAN